MAIPISLCSANRNHINAASKMDVSEIAKKLFKLHLEYANNRPLNIELVEDTLLIDASIVKFHKKKRDNKKRKRCFQKKRVYSREELEALRFHNLDAQTKKWAAVHGGLRPVVAAEYDGLVASTNKNRIVDQGSAMGRRNTRKILVH